ncbi:hypothetical protein D3C83_73950 [compost metagenome]
MNEKWRKCAVSSVWHSSCNITGIGGKGRRYIRRGYTMSGFSSFARHALAAISAVFISGLLMVNSLAVSAHEVHSVAGILA